MSVPTDVTVTRGPSALSRQLATAAVAGLLIVFGAAEAGAQDQDLRSLIDRVERLQREVTTLQRTVYQGAAPPADAQAFTADQSGNVALQIQQLELALRDVTGELETQSHRIQQLSERMDKLVADVDVRLQNIERQLSGAPVPTADAGGQPSDSAANQSGDSNNNDAPKSIGTITAAQRAAFDNSLSQGQSDAAAAAAPAVAGTQTAAIPPTSAKESYNQAFALLRQARYDDAEAALSSFLESYPDDPLAGNAKYWLGETYYVRGRYAEAAVTFAEGFQSHPNGAKAPDNLLKLGKSLAELDKVSDACATFSELLNRYPGASATVLQQARRDLTRLKCT